MKLKIYSIFILITLILGSCASKEDLVYYNKIDEKIIENNNFQTTLQTDDLLMIIVSAQDSKAAQPFNLMSTMAVNPENQAGGANFQQQLYLVDTNGNIEFPVLGTINVSGKTKDQVMSDLKQRISRYIIEPIVNIRIMNFQIAVQGEVNKPDVYRFDSERVSLPEVLSRAGDLTVYGKRNNILVIRDSGKERIIKRLDLTNADFINSDFYYLKQNDIVYVEPNKVRINSSAYGPNISVALSVISLAVTVLALTIK